MSCTPIPDAQLAVMVTRRGDGRPFRRRRPLCFCPWPPGHIRLESAGSRIHPAAAQGHASSSSETPVSGYFSNEAQTAERHRAAPNAWGLGLWFADPRLFSWDSSSMTLHHDAPGQRSVSSHMGDSTTAGTPAFKSPRESPPRGAGDETSQYAYWLMKAIPIGRSSIKGSTVSAAIEIRARFEEDVVAKTACGRGDHCGRERRVPGPRGPSTSRPSSRRCTTERTKKAFASSPAASFPTTPRRPTRTRGCTRSTTGSGRGPPIPASSRRHARGCRATGKPDLLVELARRPAS